MASSPCNTTSQPNIFSLPQELIEQTLIISALCGFPSAIASLGRTCLHFYQLIYRCTDQHLWREIFLTTFDDPRLASQYKASLTGPCSPPELEQELSFDWAGGFMSRIAAAKLMIRCATDATVNIHSTSSSTSSDDTERPSQLLLALRAIHSVLDTANPFPHSPKIIDFTTAVPPAFPPIIILRSSPLPFPDALQSLNAAWLENVLRWGYPRALTKNIYAPEKMISQGLTLKNSEWEETEEGHLFYKLVFLKSFIPITGEPTSPPSSVLDTDISRSTEIFPANSSIAEHTDSRSEAATSCASVQTGTDTQPPGDVESADEQIFAARMLARRRVYNLRYLMAERCWGPFRLLRRQTEKPVGHVSPLHELAVQSELEGSHTQEAAKHERSTDNSESQPAVALSILQEIDADSEEDDADDDFQPEEDFAEDEVDSEGEMGEDVIEDLLPLLNTGGLDFHNNRAHPTSVFPPPHRVVPDYAYLAAARLLVEMNLKEVFVSDDINGVGIGADLQEVSKSMEMVVDAFASLDLVRLGGAPDFWKGLNSFEEKREIEEEACDAESESGKGKARARDGDGQEVHGWDWAGVTGEWKRSICWLDYRDLLLHNLGATGFVAYDMEETMRIFPMTLRISGYSPPPVPPSPSPLDPLPHDIEPFIYKLPIIHVEGESKGSDVDESVRMIKGTVRMIGGGAVRWTLTSSHPDSDNPEWVTEGVQVGAIGSAVGVLGMWTGSEHIRTDPLGPFWAWKVA